MLKNTDFLMHELYLYPFYAQGEGERWRDAASVEPFSPAHPPPCLGSGMFCSRLLGPTLGMTCQLTPLPCLASGPTALFRETVLSDSL